MDSLTGFCAGVKDSTIEYSMANALEQKLQQFQGRIQSGPLGKFFPNIAPDLEYASTTIGRPISAKLALRRKLPRVNRLPTPPPPPRGTAASWLEVAVVEAAPKGVQKAGRFKPTGSACAK